jgi:UDP:flavonoid glycosyltransferase YjiC (YdhE family)
LSAAIRTADPGIQARAAALGQAIRSEDGVAAAADLCEAYVRSGRLPS